MPAEADDNCCCGATQFQRMPFSVVWTLAFVPSGKAVIGSGVSARYGTFSSVMTLPFQSVQVTAEMSGHLTSSRRTIRTASYGEMVSFGAAAVDSLLTFVHDAGVPGRKTMKRVPETS